MADKVKVLWKEWQVMDALDRPVATFDSLAAAKDFNRRYYNHPGLFIDRIETLDARNQSGDLIRVRFGVV